MTDQLPDQLPGQFIVKRVSTEYVSIRYVTLDLEEIEEIHEFKARIKTKLPETEAQKALDRIYGFYEVLFDLDLQKVYVKTLASADYPSLVNQFLAEKVFTIQHLREQSLERNNSNEFV